MARHIPVERYEEFCKHMGMSVLQTSFYKKIRTEACFKGFSFAIGWV